MINNRRDVVIGLGVEHERHCRPKTSCVGADIARICEGRADFGVESERTRAGSCLLSPGRLISGSV